MHEGAFFGPERHWALGRCCTWLAVANDKREVMPRAPSSLMHRHQCERIRRRHGLGKTAQFAQQRPLRLPSREL